MTQRNLKDVATFAAAAGFTQGQLRWWLFQAANNGLAASGAIVRIGRRVYLDADRFWIWVDTGVAAQTRNAAPRAAA